MELRRIRMFLVVAEKKSFSEAARELFVSHSAVSRGIGELESSLGIKLFERSNTGVMLTKNGKQFLAPAEKIVALYDETLSLMGGNSD